MPVDFNRVDAALFAIEKYFNAIVNDNGRHADHAEYFLDLTHNLRCTIANQAKLGDVVQAEPPLYPVKQRPADKGMMSDRTRQILSRKMKAYWRRRKKAEKGKRK